MMVGESIVLTLFVGVVGTVRGVVALQVLLPLGMAGLIEPVYLRMSSSEDLW